MPGKITMLSGLERGNEYYFDRTISIGRSESSGIVLKYPSVSREHAQINSSGGQYFIRDLKSNNGTFVNGRIVSEKQALKSGDVIQISNFEMKFDIAGKDAGDPKSKHQKSSSPLQTDTATGFMDVHSINLSDIEKQLKD